jgi:hypothetical protein
MSNQEIDNKIGEIINKTILSIDKLIDIEKIRVFDFFSEKQERKLLKLYIIRIAILVIFYSLSLYTLVINRVNLTALFAFLGLVLLVSVNKPIFSILDENNFIRSRKNIRNIEELKTQLELIYENQRLLDYFCIDKDSNINLEGLNQNLEDLRKLLKPKLIIKIGKKIVEVMSYILITLVPLFFRTIENLIGYLILLLIFGIFLILIFLDDYISIKKSTKLDKNSINYSIREKELKKLIKLSIKFIRDLLSILYSFKDNKKELIDQEFQKFFAKIEKLKINLE